jgi:hypothetical protein
MGWIIFLMTLFVYGYAILCVMIFGDKQYAGWDFEYFETVPSAMFTLFSIAIVAEWPSIVRPVMRQDYYYSLVFIVFLFLAGFGFLNLIIGIICENANEATLEWRDKQLQEEKARMLQTVSEVADQVFGEGPDGSCSPAGMEDAMEAHMDFVDKLRDQIKFPHGCQIQDLYILLTSKDQLSKKAFVGGLTRLITSGDFQRDCSLQVNLNKMRREIIKAGLSRSKAHTEAAQEEDNAIRLCSERISSSANR